MKCEDKNQGDFYGMESWGKALYKEITVPEQVIYTDGFSDAEGNISKDLPETLVQLDFIVLDGQTKLVNRVNTLLRKPCNKLLIWGC